MLARLCQSIRGHRMPIHRHSTACFACLPTWLELLPTLPYALLRRSTLTRTHASLHPQQHQLHQQIVTKANTPAHTHIHTHTLTYVHTCTYIHVHVHVHTLSSLLLLLLCGVFAKRCCTSQNKKHSADLVWVLCTRSIFPPLESLTRAGFRV